MEFCYYCKKKLDRKGIVCDSCFNKMHSAMYMHKYQDSKKHISNTKKVKTTSITKTYEPLPQQNKQQPITKHIKKTSREYLSSMISNSTGSIKQKWKNTASKLIDSAYSDIDINSDSQLYEVLPLPSTKWGGIKGFISYEQFEKGRPIIDDYTGKLIDIEYYEDQIIGKV